MKRPVQAFWPAPWRRTALALVHTEPLYNTNHGSQSAAVWSGGFCRGYPNSRPDQNHKFAVKSVSDVCKGGLENLKKLVEGS